VSEVAKKSELAMQEEAAGVDDGRGTRWATSRKAKKLSWTETTCEDD